MHKEIRPFFGADAYAKARLAPGETVLAGLAARGTRFRDSLVECLGAGACRPQGVDPALAKQLTEVVLRVAVADDDRAALEKFARELMPLVTAGPPGTTGYAAGPTESAADVSLLAVPCGSRSRVAEGGDSRKWSTSPRHERRM